eukprot:CAMPEP_0184547034 /NCGR_PEP_ID=MMETSP0199_2-20130426/5316_1 /TAXON_ID=1112570 /ORGANISM="Thraustochytrium sp., Strain LLF1b" /LENGTH=2056 /DNA_ID=CAMNT_0026941483 /DNA_START=405 /DNA_END=6575 /DNA_ORIENTATION=-
MSRRSSRGRSGAVKYQEDSEEDGMELDTGQEKQSSGAGVSEDGGLKRKVADGPRRGPEAKRRQGKAAAENGETGSDDEDFSLNESDAEQAEMEEIALGIMANGAASSLTPEEAETYAKFAMSGPKRERKKVERDNMKAHDQVEEDIFEDNLDMEEEDEEHVLVPVAPPTLKIDKLLAYARKTREAWDDFCKDMNTSKVVRGRRIEIVRMEEAGDQAEAEASALKAAEDAAEAAQEPVVPPTEKTIAKFLRRIKRRKRKVAQKRLRREETRYLVKWVKESFLHVSWETSKSLKAYLNDIRLVDRHVRKLESSYAMMEEEELADLQKIDRIVDYNTFVEEEPIEEPSGKDGSNKSSDTLAANKGENGSNKDQEANESDDSDDSDMEEAASSSKPAPAAAGGAPVADSNASGKLRWEYLVKWKSQGYEDATWELKEDVIDIEGCEAAIKLFEERDSDKFRLSRGKLGKVDSTYRSSQEFRNNRKLRSYQVDAVNWLTFNFSNGRGSILADEMGLGKTCQTVTYIHRLRHSLGVSGPFLIVAPLATLPHWQREFEAWTHLNAITYHGSGEGRELMRQKEFFWADGTKKGPNNMPRFDALITNYETILSDAMELRKFKWSLLVVDEAHRLKNRDSRLTVCLRETFKFGATMLLTGTPIQNSLPELWTLLNFIAPQDFASLENFKSKYESMTTAEAMDHFHDRLRPYMLRRIKSEVEPLPDREDTLIEVELTILQKRFYRAIYEKNTEHLMAGVEKGSRVSLNNVAMELRKCCCHPYLIEGVESKILSDNPIPAKSTLEERQAHIFGRLVEASGKLILLDKLLPKLKAEGHRVLIFSQMTRMLDILEDYLLFRQYAYERIDGSVRGVDRQFAIDRFSSAKSQSFAFLLSTRGCGQGINLTAADTVIMYDGDWNPQNDVQALARCHRIGQTKKVKVYRLITRKTYEQTMFQKASMKLGLDKAVMTGITAEASGTTKENSTRKSKSKKEQDRETERLLRYGAYALTEDQEDDVDAKKFVDADIDEILSKRATVMVSADEDNRLSRTTFVGSEGTNLDVDDPDFWTKVVHLKQAKPQEEELDLAENRAARRRKAQINPTPVLETVDSEEDEEDDKGANVLDETPDGRKVWLKKHYLLLQLALNMFGYARYDKSFEIVNQKFPGRFTEEQVEDAVRGFLVYCALKRKEKGSNDQDSDSDESEVSDSNDEENDDEAQNTTSGKVTDFTLVNLSSVEAANRIESSFSGFMDGHVYRKAVIPDLRKGKTFTIPDVLVSRCRTRVSDDQDGDELFDSDSDDSELEEEARAAKRTAKRGIAYNDDIARRVKKTAAKFIRMLDKHYKINEIVNERKDPVTGELRTENFPKVPGQPPTKWWKRSDDLKLMQGLQKHGWDPRRASDSFLAIKKDPSIVFSFYAENASKIGQQTLKLEAVKEETKAEATGDKVESSKSADADVKQETKVETLSDQTVNKADAEMKSSSTEAPTEKSNLLPDVAEIKPSADGQRAPIVKEEASSKAPADDSAESSKLEGSDAIQEVSAPTAKPEENLAGKSDDKPVEEAPVAKPETSSADEVKTESDTASKVGLKSPSEETTSASACVPASGDVKEETGTTSMEVDKSQNDTAADQDAGEKLQDEVAKKSDQVQDSEAAKPAPIERKSTADEDHDPNWPTNHKLGLRAKRIVDWFRMQERKDERLIRKKEMAKERAEKKDVEPPKRRKPPVLTEWTKSEKRSAYKGLLRYGMPAKNPPRAVKEFHLTYDQFLVKNSMTRKSSSLLEEHLKTFLQDAMQMRINAGMPAPSRNADILTSSTSAKKLLERVNMLRDLRVKVLIFSDKKLDEVIREHFDYMDNRKKTSMPSWWTVEHDIGLVKGSAKHGAGSTNAHEDLRTDRTLPFYNSCAPVVAPNAQSAASKADDEDGSTVLDNGDDDMEESDTPADEPGEAKLDGSGEGKNTFPSVVDIMNRLRALVDLFSRHHQQTFQFRGDKENGMRVANEQEVINFMPKPSSTGTKRPKDASVNPVAVKKVRQDGPVTPGAADIDRVSNGESKASGGKSTSIKSYFRPVDQNP